MPSEFSNLLWGFAGYCGGEKTSTNTMDLNIKHSEALAYESKAPGPTANANDTSLLHSPSCATTHYHLKQPHTLRDGHVQHSPISTNPMHAMAHTTHSQIAHSPPPPVQTHPLLDVQGAVPIAHVESSHEPVAHYRDWYETCCCMEAIARQTAEMCLE